MSSGADHWLLELARTEGLDGIEDLHLPSDTPIRKAWSAILDAIDVPPRALAEIMAQRFRLEVADVKTADPQAMRLVPESLARLHHVCPLREDYRRLVVATSNPTDLAAEQALQFASGRTIRFEVASPLDVEEGILLLYAPDQAAMRVFEEDADGEGLAETISLVEDEVQEDSPTEATLGAGPVVKLVNMVLKDAIHLRASDIHLQPTENGGLIRYRVDGVLRTIGTLPLAALTRVVSRVKVMSKLDIADRLRPQDGRARVAFGSRLIDLRVSTVPTRRAEKAVIRILDPLDVKNLDELGFLPDELQRFRELVDHRDGIVVVTGPTGSGKTTTMYAAIREVSDEGINVMTVEDPVEFDLSGMTQIQVDPKQGVTFASALRAILRQDPDVIFVGEIRDPETAAMAVQASMTGHLVLATLHTNTAVGSLKRLLDLGLDTGSLNETFRGAVAQRLMRRPCSECREEVGDRLTEREEAATRRYGIRPSYRPVGCEKCGQTGYQGRVPIFQVMLMTPDLRTHLQDGATPDLFVEAAREGGMRSLAEAAAARVKRGDTTLEELERVLGEVDEIGELFEGPMLSGGGGADAPQGESATKATNGPAAHPPTSPVSSGEGASDAVDSPLILIVDDDPTARAPSRALLEMEGCRVVEAEDGLAALEMLEQGGQLPNLVVLDLSMPRLDGEATLLRLRERFTAAELPVIIVTGATDTDTEIRLVESGADDYVRKPMEPRLFLSRVRAALRRSRG